MRLVGWDGEALGPGVPLLRVVYVGGLEVVFDYERHHAERMGASTVPTFLGTMTLPRCMRLLEGAQTSGDGTIPGWPCAVHMVCDKSESGCAGLTVVAQMDRMHRVEDGRLEEGDITMWMPYTGVGRAWGLRPRAGGVTSEVPMRECDDPPGCVNPRARVITHLSASTHAGPR